MPVVVGFVSVTVLVLEAVHDKDKRKLIIGTLCVCFAPLSHGKLFLSNPIIKVESRLSVISHNQKNLPSRNIHLIKLILQYFDTCFMALAEDGDPNPKCEVHALLAVSLQLYQ